MSKVEKQSAALAVIVADPVTVDGRSKIIEAAKAQLETLVSHRKQAPYRAIALGLLEKPTATEILLLIREATQRLIADMRD